MHEFEQSNYNALYIKRQEQILLEQIKKNIDYEVKLTMLFDSLKETRNELEEFKQNNNVQNEVLQQATRSIEDLTNKNKNLQNEFEKISGKLPVLEKTINEINKTKETITVERDNLLFRFNDLQKEMKRQQEEMQSIFNENNDLKVALEISNQKKTINKKKPVEPTSAVLLDDNVF
jgi:chromosome segregation ATPase